MTDSEILLGRDEPPPGFTVLRAGPIEMTLAPDGDLRWLRTGELELVRRVFVTVRDRDWIEIPARVSALDLAAREASFELTFVARHESSEISFGWVATVSGDESGRIDYTIDGIAERAFPYCRIGLCVLHPAQMCKGRPFRATTPAGELVSGTLPRRIGIQRYVDGVFLGIFDPFERLVLEQEGRAEVTFEFDGDYFEMEDQRNWTDASFKTYCTPMNLGYPHQAFPGQRFRQSVVVSANVTRQFPRVTEEAKDATTLVVDRSYSGRWPSLGVRMGDHDLSEREIELIGALRLDHLRIDLPLDQALAQAVVARADRIAARLGAALEVGVLMTREPDGGLSRIVEPLARTTSRLARVLVVAEGEETTSAERMDVARRSLAPAIRDTPLFGGTNAYFTEINRTRPDLSSLDGVNWTINPQIHASDEASLFETLEMQSENVCSARSFCGDTPLSVSCVTLKPPFNADASVDAQASADVFAANVDARQMSLAGAAWTLGSLKYLSESGLDSVTYYETTGPRGLMEPATDGVRDPGFPSFPGMVFPAYHVMASFAQQRQARLVAVHSSDSLQAIATGAVDDLRTVLLVASLLPRPQDVLLTGVHSGRATVRHLDLATAPIAMMEPATFAKASQSVALTDSGLRVSLGAYAVVRIEFSDR